MVDWHEVSRGPNTWTLPLALLKPGAFNATIQGLVGWLTDNAKLCDGGRGVENCRTPPTASRCNHRVPTVYPPCKLPTV
jgi:hypothetical protein